MSSRALELWSSFFILFYSIFVTIVHLRSFFDHFGLDFDRFRTLLASFGCFFFCCFWLPWLLSTVPVPPPDYLVLQCPKGGTQMRFVAGFFCVFFWVWQKKFPINFWLFCWNFLTMTKYSPISPENQEFWQHNFQFSLSFFALFGQKMLIFCANWKFLIIFPSRYKIFLSSPVTKRTTQGEPSKDSMCVFFLDSMLCFFFCIPPPLNTQPGFLWGMGWLLQ